MNLKPHDFSKNHIENPSGETLADDIYFTPEWGEVSRYIEDGEPKIFKCNSDYGTIQNQFMLRKIPLETKKQYYDITTPYGYGGPVITECEKGCEAQLVTQYEKEFAKYCSDHDIVSEFVRFHPIVGNALDFKEIYHAQCIRQTVGTDLTKDDPVKEEFSKSCRRNIRKAIKFGLTWEVTQNPSDVSLFIQIYYATMDRNRADKFYYFPEIYFKKCLELFGDHVLLITVKDGDKVVAADFNLCCRKLIHNHLSGELAEYLYLFPRYAGNYAVATWGKEHGYSLIHHGGGRSNDPEDSLFMFKRQFTKDCLFDFYVGKKVWNQEAYDLLVNIKEKKTGHNINTDFFPEYRYGGGDKPSYIELYFRLFSFLNASHLPYLREVA